MTSDAETEAELPDLGDRYVVDATIGTGGMASVARAHDRKTNQPVALKRLHDHLADDPHFEKILLDEARLQTIIEHPNVVATLAVGRMDGRLTLVLELVEGSSLARLMRLRDAVDPAIVVEIGCQILAGLEAAHEACDEQGRALDLVHRDVSPQNVLLDREGAVKLADFGVARARSRLQTTTEGRIKGKLAYMSPEQIEGHPLDARSDLFSTGVVLWELSTGTRLFQGDSEGELVRKVLSRPIPRASTVRADIPAELDDVLAKALLRDPKDRWQSAKEMREALEASHPRSGAEAVAAIAPEAPSAVHVVTRGASAFAPTAEHGSPEKPERSEGTEIVSRESVRRAPRRRIAFIALATVVTLGITIAGLRWSESQTPNAPTSAPAPAPASAAFASASASASALASAPASASASSATSPSPPVKPRPSSRAPLSAPSSSSAMPAAARPSCDPPYRVDERGVRVFRTECL
jgi:eukaryotic-like serine/threonine-protein kinase